MNLRDINSYDIAELVIMGAKIEESLDNLNATISRVEQNLISNLNMDVIKGIGIYNDTMDLVKPLLIKLTPLVENILSTILLSK